MVILIAILMFLVLGFSFELIDDGKEKSGIIIFLTGVIALLILILHPPVNRTKVNTPEAIDVYRGKTELQVTYRDTIVIDSTVVWLIK